MGDGTLNSTGACYSASRIMYTQSLLRPHIGLEKECISTYNIPISIMHASTPVLVGEMVTTIFIDSAGHHWCKKVFKDLVTKPITHILYMAVWCLETAYSVVLDRKYERQEKYSQHVGSFPFGVFPLQMPCLLFFNIFINGFMIQFQLYLEYSITAACVRSKYAFHSISGHSSFTRGSQISFSWLSLERKCWMTK